MTEKIGNRYHILDEIGRGGMGIVYKAADRLTGETVALKSVTVPESQLRFASISNSTDFRLSLAQEFKVLSSLRHPHIISVLDYGFDQNNIPFFTMELLKEPLNILRYGEDQPLERQIELFIQMLQALIYLHRRGIIHRDLKPDNVLVHNHQVKVLDFGLAIAQEHMHDDSEVSGTIAYMAPEILQGHPASESSDLYALGMIMYEILTGHHPFDTFNIGTLIQSIFYDQPDTSLLDERLAPIVERLLIKEPSVRYTDAQEVLQACAATINKQQHFETRDIRESFLQAAKFVGREAEFDMLNSALGNITHTPPRGSAWLIGGESGVGKSRLLDEMRTQALVEGAIVMRGQAIMEGGAPYQLWRDVMRWLVLLTEDLTEEEMSVAKEMVPDIEVILSHPVPDAPPLAPQNARDRLLIVFESLFRRQKQPIVVILEDLQWTIESLYVLNHVYPLCTELPLLIIGSYRNDERPQLHSDLSGMNLITLYRLNEENIRQLSGAILGEVGRNEEVVDLIHRETEGNIFFIVEVIRALAEEAGHMEEIGKMTLPQNVFAGGIKQIIQRRLQRISGEERPLLEVAATAGRFLDLELLQYSAPEKPLDDWLVICADNAILEFHEGQWRFSHDKLREGVLESIPEKHIRELHQQVAEAIEALYPDDNTRVAALAGHWQRAENLAKECHYARLAGDQLMQVFLFQESIVYYKRALELTPKDSPERIHLLVRLGEAYSLDDYNTARTYLKEVLELTQKQRDYQNRASVLTSLARIAMLRDGDLQKAEEYQQEALLSARKSEDALTLSTALRQLGNFNIITARFDEAENYLKEAVEVGKETGDMYTYGMALNSLSDIYAKRNVNNDHDLAIDLSIQVRDIGYEMGNRRLQMMGIAHLGLVAMHRENYAESYKYFLEAFEITRQIRDLEQLGKVGNYVSICLLNIGNLDEALDFFLQSLQISMNDNSIPEVIRSLCGIAIIFEQRDRPEDALQLLALTLNHPKCTYEAHLLADDFYKALQEKFPPNTSQRLIQRGQTYTLETVARNILTRLTID